MVLAKKIAPEWLTDLLIYARYNGCFKLLP